MVILLQPKVAHYYETLHLKKHRKTQINPEKHRKTRTFVHAILENTLGASLWTENAGTAVSRRAESIRKTPSV